MKKLFLGVLAMTVFAIFSSITSTAFAQSFTFANDLSVGASNPDVAMLQDWLISNGYDIPAVSLGKAAKGYFGAQTKLAVMKFQAANGIPNTGYVGKLTRGRLNGGDNAKSLIVSSPNGGETWVTHEMQTIVWKGAQGVLSGKGYIELQPYRPACAEPGNVMQCKIAVQPNFVIAKNIDLSAQSYSWNVGQYQVEVEIMIYPPPQHFVPDGQYKIVICKDNGVCDSSDAYFTISADGRVVNPLKLTAPNGGEDWKIGQMQKITWTSPLYIRATDAEIKLIEYREPFACPAGYSCMPIPSRIYTIAKDVNISQNSFVWIVGSYDAPNINQPNAGAPIPISAGRYYMQICEQNTVNCDQSDQTFTISQQTGLNPAVQVISPNGGEKLAQNSTYYIKWLPTDIIGTNTKVDIYLDQTNIYCITAPCGQTYILDKNIPLSTAYNWIVATDINNKLIPAADYKMRVCFAGTTACDSSDAFFTITPEAANTITLTSPNGGETYKIGTTKTISWKTTGNIGQDYKVMLSFEPGFMPITVVPATQSSYSFKIPETTCIGGDACGTFQSGSYTVKIGLYDGQPCAGFCLPSDVKLLAEDESDGTVSVTN